MAHRLVSSQLLSLPALTTITQLQPEISPPIVVDSYRHQTGTACSRSLASLNFHLRTCSAPAYHRTPFYSRIPILTLPTQQPREPACACPSRPQQHQSPHPLTPLASLAPALALVLSTLLLLRLPTSSATYQHSSRATPPPSGSLLSDVTTAPNSARPVWQSHHPGVPLDSLDSANSQPPSSLLSDAPRSRPPVNRTRQSRQYRPPIDPSAQSFETGFLSRLPQTGTCYLKLQPAGPSARHPRSSTCHDSPSSLTQLPTYAPLYDLPHFPLQPTTSSSKPSFPACQRRPFDHYTSNAHHDLYNFFLCLASRLASVFQKPCAYA